jgi:hypothetical protein
MMLSLIQNISTNRFASNYKEAKLKELTFHQLLEEDVNVVQTLYRDEITKLGDNAFNIITA